jgi:hypothetical protein
LVGEFFRLRLRACKIGHSVLHFRLMCPSQGGERLLENLLMEEAVDEAKQNIDRTLSSAP